MLVRAEGAYYAQEQPSGLIVATHDGVVDREAPEIGTVLAVGPGKVQMAEERGVSRVKRPVRVPMDVAVGDRVLFSRYAGDDVDDGISERRVIMRQDEIIARVVG